MYTEALLLTTAHFKNVQIRERFRPQLHFAANAADCGSPSRTSLQEVCVKLTRFGVNLTLHEMKLTRLEVNLTVPTGSLVRLTEFRVDQSTDKYIGFQGCVGL